MAPKPANLELLESRFDTIGANENDTNDPLGFIWLDLLLQFGHAFLELLQRSPVCSRLLQFRQAQFDFVEFNGV